MKVKVIKKFIDVHSKEIHAVGDELEITDARYKEICKVGKFVEVVKEQEASASTTTKKTTVKKGSAE